MLNDEGFFLFVCLFFLISFASTFSSFVYFTDYYTETLFLSICC